MLAKMTVWPENVSGKETEGELTLLGNVEGKEEIECLLELHIGDGEVRFEVNVEDLENAVRAVRAFTVRHTRK